MTSNQYFDEFGLFAEIRSTNFTMPSMHAHLSYELYFLLAGNREYFIGDKFIKVYPGDVVLIPPNTLHRTGGGGSNRALLGFKSECLYKFFSPEVAKKMLSAFNNHHVHPADKDGDKIISIINELRENQAEGRQKNSYLLLGELLYILCGLPQLKDDTFVPENHVDAIIKYVQDNYRKIHGVEDTAEKFFLNKSYFCRSFKRETGINFVDYLNKVKLKAAADMLTFSDKSIREIAERTGFNSVSYFCNLFKKEYGASPLTYKKTFVHQDQI